MAPQSSYTEPTDVSLWSPRYRALVFGLTLIVTFTAFEGLAVATILPAVTKDLGGLSLYGWVFSAFLLSDLVGIVISGAEADQHSPAHPFAVGVTLFVVGLIIAGMAPSMQILVAGRVIQGLGAGANFSMAYVAIGRGLPDRVKPKMLAIMSSAWVIPGLIGPALAGWISDHLGWRWVFAGLAPLPIVAASMALPALRRLPPSTPVPPDRQRIGMALLLAIGTGLLLAGLNSHRLLYAIPLCLPGAALAFTALQRLLPPGTLSARAGLPAAIAMLGLLNLAFFGVDVFVPLTLNKVRGQSATVAGLALTAATLTWTAGAWLQAHLTATWSRRILVILGWLLIGAAIGGIAYVLDPQVPRGLAPLIWGLGGLGMGLAYSTSKLVILENMPAGQEGAVSASMQLTDALGSALGTGIGGAVLAALSAGNASPRSGIFTTDMLMLVVVGVGIVAATQLPTGRPHKLDGPF